MDPSKHSMKAQLPQLRALQDIDRQIFRVARDRRDKPRALETLEKEVAGKKADYDAKGKEAKLAKVEVEKRELDLKEREERKKKLELQRDQAKSNKEYTAFNFEINTIKADSSKIEDEVLKLMGGVEEAMNVAGESKKILDEVQGRYDAQKKVVDGELGALDEHLKGLKEKRAAAAAAVDPDFLKIYDRIHKNKPDAVALASVVKEGAEWQCGACHMDVNFQEVNVIMKGKDPVTCRSCSRILYLEQQRQPEPAK